MKTKYAFLLFIVLTIHSKVAFSFDSTSGNRWLAFDAVAGIPQLFAPQISFIKIPRLTIGFSYGSAPVSNYLKTFINTNPITVSTGSDAGTLVLYPGIDFSFRSTTFFARYYTNSDSGFFIQFIHQVFTMIADYEVDLRNEALDLTQPQVLTSTLKGSLSQIGLSVGYSFRISPAFHFTMGTGVGYTYQHSSDIDVKGFASFASTSSGSGTTLTQGTNEASQRLADVMNQAHSALRIIPYAFLSVGFAI